MSKILEVYDTYAVPLIDYLTAPTSKKAAALVDLYKDYQEEDNFEVPVALDKELLEQLATNDKVAWATLLTRTHSAPLAGEWLRKELRQLGPFKDKVLMYGKAYYPEKVESGQMSIHIGIWDKHEFEVCLSRTINNSIKVGERLVIVLDPADIESCIVHQR